MNPTHHAPIHSGSVGLNDNGTNKSAGYCNTRAPKANPRTGPIAAAAYWEAIEKQISMSNEKSKKLSRQEKYDTFSEVKSSTYSDSSIITPNR